MLRTYIGMLVALRHDRKGIAAMEYAILAAAILGAIGVAFSTIGTSLSTILAKVITDLSNYTS